MSNGVTIYEGVEHEEIPIPYSVLLHEGKLDIFENLKGNFFRISLRKSDLVFQAFGLVGIIPVNPRVSIDVRPRVPIGNLQRLLELSGQLPKEIQDHFRTYAS